MYQKEAERLVDDGARYFGVVLDFELKRAINRELAKLKDLSEQERLARKEEFARIIGLETVNGKIPVPAIRSEYEAPGKELAHVDAELAAGDYRERSLRQKSGAWFRLYAPRAELAPVRRALPTEEIMREIFAL